jgi:hypothetical protein
MSHTFYGCTSLTEAPTIPNSVTRMPYTFYGCTNLIGTVRINSKNVNYVDGCFDNITKTITLQVPAGSTTYTKFNAAYGTKITIETFN